MNPTFGEINPNFCDWVINSPEELIIKNINESENFISELAQKLLVNNGEINTFNKIIDCIKKSKKGRLDIATFEIFASAINRQQLDQKNSSACTLRSVAPIEHILMTSTPDSIKNLHKSNLIHPNSIKKSLIYLCHNPYTNHELIQLFIELGADVNFIDAQHQTPLFIASQRNPKLIVPLLQHNAIPAKDAFFRACFNPQTAPDVLQNLITKLAEIQENKDFVNIPDRNGNTSLMYACQSSPHLIATLVQNGANPRIKNPLGLSAILFLSKHSSPTFEHFRELLQAGANINDCDYENHHIFHTLFVAKVINLDLIKKLLSLNANIYALDKHGNSILHYACESNISPEVIQFVLENVMDPKAFLEHTNTQKLSALHIACGHSNNPSVIATLLHYAKHYQTSNLEQSDVLGRKPLDIACTHNPQYIEILVENGAIPESNLLSLLCSNPSNPVEGFTFLLNLLAKTYNPTDLINEQDDTGKTLLMKACELNASFIKPLIDKGADVFLNKKTQSPLLIACFNKHASLEDIKAIVEAAERKGLLHAYLNQTDENQICALQAASFKHASHPEIIDYLISKGAKASVTHVQWGSLLHLICRSQDATPEAVQKIISAVKNEDVNFDAYINLQSSEQTALGVALQAKINPKVIELLINETRIDPTDLSYLHFACQHPGMKESTLKVIIEAGRYEQDIAEYLNTTLNGKNALEVACQANPINPNTVLFLHKLGARTTAGNLLHHLCKNPSVDHRILNFFIKNTNDHSSLKEYVNEGDQEGLSPLEIVCLRNPVDLKSIRVLVDAGASLVFLSSDLARHESILPCACSNKHLTPQQLEYLIQLTLRADPKALDFQNTTGETPLHICLESNPNPHNIQILLKYGANVFIPNLENSSPLHIACATSNIDPTIIKLLLSTGKKQDASFDLVNHQDLAGRTALHIALLANPINLDVVSLLLEMGANCDLTDCNNESPLHFACRNPSATSRCIQLLAKPETINSHNEKEETPLHLLALRENPSLELFQVLFDLGADVDYVDHNENSPLHNACENPEMSAEIIEAIIAKSQNPWGLVMAQNNDKYTSLHYICENSELPMAVLEILVKRIGEDLKEYLEAKTDIGLTAIQIACTTIPINAKLVKALIKLGANLDVTDQNGNTLLHILCHNSGPEVAGLIKKIIKKTPHLRLQINKNGNTPLHLICQKSPFDSQIFNFLLREESDLFVSNAEYLTCLELLIRNSKVDSKILKELFSPKQLQQFASYKFKLDFTLLHWACAENRSLIRLLLKSRSDIHALTTNKLSVLHLICTNIDATPRDFERLIKKITKSSPDEMTEALSLQEHLELKSTNNELPLLNACSNNFKLVELLLKWGADASKVPLFEICKNHELPREILELYIEALKKFPDFASLINQQDSKGLSALHHACISNLDLLECLISNGVKRELGDSQKRTALFHLCLNKNVQLEHIQLFIKDNAAELVNHQDICELTPFHVACKQTSFEVIKTLIPYANFFKDNEGRAPFFFVLVNSRLSLNEIYALLDLGLPIDSFAHPNFPLSEFLSLVIQRHNTFLLISAIQKRLSIKKIHEFFNTSSYFNVDAYFNLIKNYLFHLLMTPLIQPEEIEFELDYRKALNESLPHIFAEKESQFTGNPLEIPLLLQDTQLMMKFESAILKHWGEVDLASFHDHLWKSSFAREDLQNMRFTVNPAHFSMTSSENKDIPPGPNFDLDNLEKMFLEINFTNPDLPGYRDPKKLTCDGDPTTIEILHKGTKLDGEGGIQGLIKRIREKPRDFTGVPKDETEYLKHYEDFENVLRHLGNLLLHMDDANAKATILIDIAVMGQFCGGKIVEAKRMYALYCTPFQELDETLPLFAGNHLQGHRQGILENWAKKIPGAAYETHRFSQFMYLVGETLNLPFFETFVEDEYSGIQIGQEEVLTRFQYEYTPTEIFRNVKGFLLDRLSNPKLRELIVDWFKDNAPTSYEHTERFKAALQKIEDLKALKKSRQEIRQILLKEDEIYLSHDESVKSAILNHRKQNYLQEYKVTQVEEWNKPFYDRLLANVRDMEKAGLTSAQIYDYLKTQIIDLQEDISPEAALTEHRRLEHFNSLIKEEDWNKSFYDDILQKASKMSRSEARQYLLENKIPFKKDRKLKTLLKEFFKSELLETLLPYEVNETTGDVTYSISDETVFHLLKKMHILS
ncbi:putative uncharacterized protein [Parachlamydia acanthamoebae UV-7]|uniref:Uncharacterized protein n=1 Tax=Parachlamydia acanthamoebae (strain UV7) TaxID=765952 RepID=F8KYT4_PARAV|nr:ankyrin repeat domain-containing protein [Parachlamydia acanthamoebae]CCB86043.1 putative uncharacterized protein [Parachlamydia acanthamoebae UV-7]